MAATSRRLARIFGSLESAGFPRTLQKSLLPEWVTTEVLADDAASVEVAAILAKRLGLRTSLLLRADEPTVELLRRRETKYKRSIPNRSKNVVAATSVAVFVAETVAAACRHRVVAFEDTAKALREDVLAQFPGHWLGLRNLLMRCWAGGVPVVHIAQLGPGITKMDGMVVQTASRPVIVLSKGSELWAWQLFVLAHEIGHIALGHVSADEILVDEQLGAASYALDDADADEQAADSFAIELLNGRPAASYAVSTSRVNGPELADAAFEYGKRHHVDPGHIALNYAHSVDSWTVGQAAAKILQGQNPPASAVINDTMWGSIDVEAISRDSVEYLKKATGSAVA